MKASELTPDDVGKWVNLRAQILAIDLGSAPPAQVKLQGGARGWLVADTILEFTDPPAPVQEVGDVFRMQSSHEKTSTQEWTLSAIVGDVCLLTGPVENGQTNGFQSTRYPLDPKFWTLLRKGAPA